MAKVKIFWIFLSSLLIFYRASSSQEIRYGTGAWDGDKLGNHRVVLRVSEKSEAVWAHIPWRRPDFAPEEKGLILMEAKTGRRVLNIRAVKITREYGDIVFQPLTVPGDYYLYFMAYKVEGRNYPKVSYLRPEQTADVSWLQKPGVTRYGHAEIREIQSVDEFNSFYPMEVIATAEERQRMLTANPDADYLLFPEDRKFPVRLAADLPQRWTKAGPQDVFRGEACRGEFYAFQVAVWACRAGIDDLDVLPGDLKSSGGASISCSAFVCINTGGMDWNGERFKRVCRIDKGKIYPLWLGIQVPPDASPGTFEGSLRILPRGMKESRLKIQLEVRSDLLKDSGDSEPWRHSRLRWLNSNIAFDDEVVPPFTPMTRRQNSLSCLGRTITLDQSGLPGQIQSFFSSEVTHILSQGRDLLSGPVRLVVEKVDRSILSWKSTDLRFVKEAPGEIAWEAESISDPLKMNCRAKMEFDGFVEFKVRLISEKALEINDVCLEIPIAKEVARYMMGLGFRGGFRPPRFHWMWDQKNNQDALWIGDVNAGLQVALRAENYSRPLNTNFYLSKPLSMPPSWYNQGYGGCRVIETDERTVLVQPYGGKRTIRPGEVLNFDFNLLLTPFKPIDPKAQFSTRFFHAYKPLDEVAGTGANTINIHHANAINPYINYPFLRPKEMKAYVDEAHRRGFRVKIYYTIRELSNHAAELFALRSLGHEIFSAGPGGGYSWLQEHLGSDYIAAWFVPELKDAAIINSGLSRWHNYYLEGLDWLVKNIGIDGLYIDDLAFDRTTMKRVRKILDRGRDGALIDLHSANQYNVRDGYASSANLYLEHFPYLNRIWFGEYFDYGSSPDEWLVEISGIPFGVMGEMLQDGGNPWRGMVYGMTNRLPWSGQNPARLWRVWDDFGIIESRMFGYWSTNCPVRTGRSDVLATAYVKKNKTLIALASWATQPTSCELRIDWQTLGINPDKALLRAPVILDFQEAAVFKPGDKILVQPGKGWLLVLSE